MPVGLSSDAPYGPEDPWEVIDAAATRLAPDGRTVGADERIGHTTALGRFLTSAQQPGGPPRSIRVGAPADVVLLDRVLDEALAAGSEAVRCTMIRGRVVYRRDG